MATHRLNIILESTDKRLLATLARVCDRTMTSMIRTLLREEASRRDLVLVEGQWVHRVAQMKNPNPD